VYKLIKVVVFLLSNPFRGMLTWRPNGQHAPRYGPEMKDGEVEPKIMHRRGPDVEQSTLEGELDPAVGK